MDPRLTPPRRAGLWIAAAVTASCGPTSAPLRPRPSLPTSIRVAPAVEPGVIAPPQTEARPRFCNVSHLFCDDFDDDTFPSRWTKQTRAGGAFTLDSTSALSGSWSLLAVANGPEAYANPILDQDLGDPSAGLRCEVDARVDVHPPGAFQAVARLHVVGLSDDYAWLCMGAGMLNQQWSVAHDGLINRVEPFGNTEDGRWYHVRFEVAAGARAGSAVVSSEGKELSSTPLLLHGQARSATFSIGVFSNAVPGWRVRFDNAVCERLEPRAASNAQRFGGTASFAPGGGVISAPLP